MTHLLTALWNSAFLVADLAFLGNDVAHRHLNGILAMSACSAVMIFFVILNLRRYRRWAAR